MSEQSTANQKPAPTTRKTAASIGQAPPGSLGRRGFLGAGALGSVGALAGAGLASSFATELQERPQPWQPASDRKIKVGVVGFGVCEFGARFGFQDHPNVEIVAVSDLIPERRQGLMKAVRCGKSYESLEKLVEDPEIEAVFVATDAPSHARHCIDALEFLSAILEDRQPLVNVYEALAMTVPGVIAHQSALRDGERLAVPQFDPPSGG